MKIVHEFPPNIDDIRNTFDLSNHPDVIFTYGDTVYHPAGTELPQHLKVHEGTHIQQQKVTGAKEWWDRYLVDVDFRLEQELQAYRNQWSIISKIRNWREQEWLLNQIAADLASEIYGNVITKAEARKLITTRRKK